MGVDTNRTSVPQRAPNREPRTEGPPSGADPLLGAMIGGRYVLEQQLARGAMGCVYIARQEPFGRKVAVKLLSPQAQTESAEVFEERFLREASTLARLQHPNTVRVYDYGHHGEHTYLVMEHVDGFSLRRLQAGGPMPPSRMLHIAMQICDALQEAHALGLMHRDLKPANVLITRHAGALDVVKVVDFGLAKDFYGNSELTQAGQVLGTPMYMAPEQIRDEPCDHRIDVYALGVLLYTGMTGTTPFPKAAAMQVLMMQLKQQPPSFAEANPDVSLPPVVEQVVSICLAKDRDQRFASVAELRKALAVCRLAVENPAFAHLRIGLVDGATVLPDEVEESGSTISLKLDRLRLEDDEDEEDDDGSDRPWLERLPNTAHLAMLAIFTVSGLLTGASLERVFGP